MDLLLRYSNRSDLLDDLNRAGQQVARGLAKPQARRSVSSTDRVNRQWSLRDRLSEEQITSLVRDRLSGLPQNKTARKFGISESSVKRIMRLHRTAGKIISLS